MENRKNPIIDMTREGEFVEPPQGSRQRPGGASFGLPPFAGDSFGPPFGPPFGAGNAPLATRLGRTAIVIAVLAGLLCAAALALWFALALIPVVLAASAVAWVAYRIQLWRMRR